MRSPALRGRRSQGLLALLLGASLGVLLGGAAEASASKPGASRRTRAATHARAEPGAALEADAQAPGGVRRVHTGPHVEVHARDMRLGDTARERLERIAERYFKATHRKLVLTGGTRTPERQAQLMFEKLHHDEDIVALYENKPAATEVRDAYREGVAKGLRKAELIRAIRETIESLLARGSYVSKHLKSGAADVRSRGLTPSQELSLRAAVKEEHGVTLLDERTSAEPHFHLSLQ